ncbi:MAG: hypothetical protein EXX96DRAFT_621614 [Benjaminiella poitrasii]|nr:MAG: hypothetical protein EXX96DRAFT_621614 [Benjaminiella poitrasii]
MIIIFAANEEKYLYAKPTLFTAFEMKTSHHLTTNMGVAVTAYSRSLSKTVQAEVQQVSNPVSSTNLTDNDSCIMAFGKLDRFIVNGTDMVLKFKKFQRHSIEYIKNANYFDQNYDIHRMLALSNNLLVDKTTKPKILPDIVSKETYRLMKQELIRNHMRSVKFSEKLYKRVKHILEEYFVYGAKDELDKYISETNNESKIELLKLARKVNKYEKSAIEVIANLIPSSTNNNLSRVSELYLSGSYIHNVISSIFRFSNVVPHCSNILPYEKAETESKERPDYVCDKYVNHEYDYSTVYGEIKTKESTNSLNQDLYRTVHFRKNAIDTYN